MSELSRLSATEHLFTSESVTEGHPDKICDQISDGVLDAVMRDDPTGRVACECLVNTGLVVVAGEITTETYVDIPRLVRETLRRIGYDRAKYGFDAETRALMPMPIQIAHTLARRLAEVRKADLVPYLRPDGKTQVTVRYENDRPVEIVRLLI